MAMRAIDESHCILKRRAILRAGWALAAHYSRALISPALGVSTLLASKTASAEPVTVAVCLAVASVVFDAVKAHNNSDGGMSAMLKASLEYQRVISSQLSSVQQGIADVLLRLGTLEGAVANVAEQGRIGKMHDELSGASRQYINVTTRRGYDTYQEWVQAKDVQNELEQIAIILNKNFAIAEANQWLGPTSALYLTAATHTLLAIKFAQGRSTKVIQGYAEQLLDIYARVEETKISTSTAALSLSAQTKFQNAVRELEKLGFVVKPAADEKLSTIPVTLGYVSIQDYTPSKLFSTRFRPVSRNAGISDGATSSVGGIEERSPERIGETQHFRHVLTVNTLWSPGNLAVRQFQVSPDIKTEAVAAGPPGVPVERFLAGTAEIRLQLAVDSAHMAPSKTQKEKIEKQIADINLAAAQMALCELTLMNLRESRKAIIKQFWSTA